MKLIIGSRELSKTNEENVYAVVIEGYNNTELLSGFYKQIIDNDKGKEFECFDIALNNFGEFIPFDTLADEEGVKEDIEDRARTFFDDLKRQGYASICFDMPKTKEKKAKPSFGRK